MKRLKPIFLTDNVYILPPSVLTSANPSPSYFDPYVIIRSNGFPPNCNYFSWNSDNQKHKNRLVWVNSQVSPTNEIIQLGAWQLKYKISYKITGDDTDLKLILPFNGDYGNEPWDINGNTIRFKRCGSFVIPGWYQYFTILSTSINVEMELKIEAFEYNPNPYYDYGIFCLNTKYSSTPVFTYIFLGDNAVERIIDQKFLSYRDYVYNTYINDRKYPSCYGNFTTNGKVDSEVCTEVHTNRDSTISEEVRTDELVRTNGDSKVDSNVCDRLFSLEDDPVGYGPIISGQLDDNCDTSRFSPRLVSQNNTISNVSIGNQNIFTLNFGESSQIKCTMAVGIFADKYKESLICDRKNVYLSIINCNKYSNWILVQQFSFPIIEQTDGSIQYTKGDIEITIPRYDNYNQYSLYFHGIKYAPQPYTVKYNIKFDLYC